MLKQQVHSCSSLFVADMSAPCEVEQESDPRTPPTHGPGDVTSSKQDGGTNLAEN